MKEPSRMLFIDVAPKLPVAYDETGLPRWGFEKRLPLVALKFTGDKMVPIMNHMGNNGPAHWSAVDFVESVFFRTEPNYLD